MKALVKFIDEKHVPIAVDDVCFELKDAKDAYRRLQDRKHSAKVVIRIDHQKDNLLNYAPYLLNIHSFLACLIGAPIACICSAARITIVSGPATNRAGV